MRKKLKKKLINALLSIGLCVLSVGAIASLKGADNVFVAEAVEFSQTPEIQTEYVFGTTLEIPSVDLLYNGKEYPSQAFLISPDGTTYQTNTHSLKTFGVWSLCYKAQTENGTIISESISFEVPRSILSVGANSSVELTSYSNSKTTYEGVAVTLANGDSIDYNRIIDLNEVTDQDDLFTMFLIPNETGTADIDKVIVTFTDIYDPENVVSVQMQYTPMNSKTWAYVQAKAPGQTYLGLHYGTSTKYPTTVIGGKEYIVFRGGIYGSIIYSGFSGAFTANPEMEIGDAKFALSWNYDQRRIYGSYQRGSTLICDLDESFMVTDWSGFTTGEVRMSISASGYVSNSTTLFFTDVNGENLSVNSFKDVEAPILEVDYGKFSRECIPAAIKGSKYNIFSASAFDKYDGECEVDVRAYYSYHSNLRIEVPIVDGAFETKYVGTYSLVYSAYDLSQNLAEVVIDIQSKNASEIQTQIVLEQAEDEAFVGEWAQVASYSLQNETIDGEMTIKAVTSDGTEYEVVNGGFVPLETGEYTVYYEYHTYVFLSQASYTFTVSAKNHVAFLEQAQLPEYFLTGAKYTLPTLKAYDFSSGKAVETEVKIYVSEDNGERKLLNGNVYTVEAIETTKVIYSAFGIEEEYDVIAVNTGLSDGKLNGVAYFDVTKGEVSSVANDDGIVFTATENAELTFVNRLLVADFLGHFRAWGDGMQAVTYTFSDCYEKNNAVSLTFTNGYCSINGETKFAVPSNFSENGERMNIVYDDATCTFVFSGSVQKTVKKNLAGQAFNGFTDSTVVMSIKIETEGEGALKVEKINNQDFRADMSDADIQVDYERIRGLKEKGEVVVFEKATVGDVLSAEYSIVLSVTTPGKETAISQDGITLDRILANRDYTIELNEYGNYRVRYYVLDAEGNVVKQLQSYQMRVVDDEAPKIALGEKKTSVKLGATVQVATAQVEDNISQENEIYVFVKAPSGVITQITNGEFKADRVGVYTVMYAVYDEAGNMASAYYTVTVQGDK